MIYPAGYHNIPFVYQNVAAVSLACFDNQFGSQAGNKAIQFYVPFNSSVFTPPAVVTDVDLSFALQNNLLDKVRTIIVHYSQEAGNELDNACVRVNGSNQVIPCGIPFAEGDAGATIYTGASYSVSPLLAPGNPFLSFQIQKVGGNPSVALFNVIVANFAMPSIGPILTVIDPALNVIAGT